MGHNKTIWDTIKLGKWENCDIEWIVLSIEENRALLISKYGIHAVMAQAHDLWQNSWEREWCKGEFYRNAFSEGEKSAIEKQELKENLTPAYKEYDFVFLLSREEVEKYFPNVENRICKPTYSLMNFYKKFNNDYWKWLLRPIRHEVQTFFNFKHDFVYGEEVCSDGSIQDLDTCGRVTMIRPAMWVDLSKM